MGVMIRSPRGMLCWRFHELGNHLRPLMHVEVAPDLRGHAGVYWCDWAHRLHLTHPVPGAVGVVETVAKQRHARAHVQLRYR